MEYLLGIDAGTTSLKALLLDNSGQVISSVNEEYKSDSSSPSISLEIAPEVYWQACARAVKNILSNSEINNVGKIKALAIASQGETLIFLDREGKALRKALLGPDDRSQEEAEIIKSEFGVGNIYKVTGQPDVIPDWPAAKVLWLKRNEPHIFRKVYKYLLVEDYLIYRLTGKFVSNYSLVSSTLFFDIMSKKWWPEMLDFIGISDELLPQPMESGEVVSNLSPQAAEEIGLSTETVVVTGGLDQSCAMVGTGNIGPGIITESTGTVLAICATVAGPTLDPQMRIPLFCHVLPHTYYFLPWSHTAGLVLRWFRDTFCQEELKEAQEKEKNVYDVIIEKANDVPPGSDGLVMLPHLIGAACPEYNPRARGVFFGITPRHTKAHFIRAIVESVAFMLNKNIRILEDLGVEVSEIRAVGGGAQSELWNQIKADVTQKTIVLMNISEAASLGGAIIAGTATGIFKSIESAGKKIIKIKDRTEPDPENQAAYSLFYDTYLKLYDTLEPVFF